jgi:hypothetical protein
VHCCAKDRVRVALVHGAPGPGAGALGLWPYGLWRITTYSDTRHASTCTLVLRPATLLNKTTIQEHQASALATTVPWPHNSVASSASMPRISHRAQSMDNCDAIDASTRWSYLVRRGSEEAGPVVLILMFGEALREVADPVVSGGGEVCRTARRLRVATS